MAGNGKRSKRGWLVGLALGLLLPGASGCLVVAAGAAGGAVVGYAYYKGEVLSDFSAPFADTLAATRGALADLGTTVEKEDGAAGAVTLHGRTAGGDNVKVTVISRTAATEVGVRVGVFGNTAVSERTLDQVGARLNAAGPLRPVPAAAPALGPIQPVAALAAPGETPPPPLAAEPPPARPAGALPPEPIPVR